ncbi:hypothetical protein K469DRAFT_699617 [Zopfia rhizophila CBS 207.26]|uniref:Uncharacterized protein n=1 Tax=Zopfia rhizophila CBS 207.26 TaxID=1314779 RepID=A0A6A6EEU1_9PEZI|nr:hypothetical protein K469DRAFT_699617 [Zopfia rhizophila CBS 207.26]
MKLSLIIAVTAAAMTNAVPNPFCQQCKPLPNENKCDITTSCTYVWGHPGPNGPYYCACRAGYRATGYKPDDATVQWRLPWYGPPSQEGRVFVAPGVKCDTLCDHWELGAKGCQEVQLKKECF